jgi:hypothetical protein
MITSYRTVSYRNETAGVSDAVENRYFLSNPPVSISIPTDLRRAETPLLFHPFAVSHVSNLGLPYKLWREKTILDPCIKVASAVCIMTPIVPYVTEVMFLCFMLAFFSSFLTGICAVP